jgi:hypothetical protein
MEEVHRAAAPKAKRSATPVTATISTNSLSRPVRKGKENRQIWETVWKLGEASLKTICTSLGLMSANETSKESRTADLRMGFRQHDQMQTRRTNQHATRQITKDRDEPKSHDRLRDGAKYDKNHQEEADL